MYYIYIQREQGSIHDRKNRISITEQNPLFLNAGKIRQMQRPSYPQTLSLSSQKSKAVSLLRIPNRDGPARNPQRRARELPGGRRHGDLSQHRSHLRLSRQPINDFLRFLLDLPHLAVNWNTHLLKSLHIPVLHSI